MSRSLFEVTVLVERMTQIRITQKHKQPHRLWFQLGSKQIHVGKTINSEQLKSKQGTSTVMPESDERF